MRELVDRAKEQARLGLFLDRAAAGDGGLMIIRGEAGIGKTALARWAEAEARTRGFQAIRGRCHANGSELSYGPLIEAFGRVLRAATPAELGHLTERIAGLSVLFPGLVEEPDLAAVPDELALTRTLEAFRGVLIRLAAAGSLLLVIEDVQWADPATLRALAHLSGELETAPIAIVLTMRDGDETDEPDLQVMLAAVRRTCPVEEIEPGRLGLADTERMLVAVTGGPIAADVAAEIHRRTAGTPLFVEALGQELGSERRADRSSRLAGTPPAAVRDAMAERLHGLGEDGVDVLVAVAAGGASADLETVQEVTQLDDQNFAAAIERLLARSLISVGAGPEHSVEVAHPLLAEVVQHRLPPPELARVHARYLAVIDGADGEVDPELAALHALGAGGRIPDDQIIDVLARAAAQAASRQAYRSTAAYATRALELIKRLDRPTEELAIRHRLAGALLGAGDYGNAGTVAEDAIGLDVDDPVARLPVLCQAELAAWLTGSGGPELARLDEAANNLPANDLRPEVLRTLEFQLTAHVRRDSIRTVGLLEKIIERTADATDPPAKALHAIGLMYRHEFNGHHHKAVGPARELLATAGADLPPWQIHRARVVLVDCLVNTGPVHELRNAAAAIGGDGVGMHVSWRDHIVDYLSGLAFLEPGCLDLTSGPDVFIGADSAAQWPDPVVVAHRAWLLADAEAVAAVAAELAEKRRRFPERRSVLAAIDSVENYRVLISGDRAAAADRVRNQAPGSWSSSLGRERQEVAHRLMVLAGDYEGAAKVEDVLRRFDGGSGWASAQAGLLHGLRLVAATRDAATADPDREAIEAVLVDAAARLDAVGDHHRMAIGLTVLAEKTGTVDPRLPPLHGPIATLGLTALADRIGAVVAADGGAAVSPAVSPKLTRRQREIAELVAEGLSNAAIADRLFISVRTVTSHLDHIYTKLDIGNRTELAVLLPGLD